MKKLSVALGTAIVCLVASSAWAGGAPDSIPYDNSMDYSGMDSSMDYSGMDSSMDYSSGMPSGFNMPVNPNMLANNYANVGGGMDVGGIMPGSYPTGSMEMMPMMGGGMMGSGMGMGNSYPNFGGMPMPSVDMRQVVSQGVRSLPRQQQMYGAYNMARQNIGQLNQGMSNGMSPIYQMRNSIRNQIMGNRINDISRMGQSTFRPLIQPGAVQSMISQIQPWNFPIRFQSAMMPAMAPYVSQSIKPRQMAYMQQGILNNPNFPFPTYNNGGMGGYGGYGGGMGGYGGYDGGYGMGGMGMGMGGYGMGMPMQQQNGGMMGGGYYGY